MKGPGLSYKCILCSWPLHVCSTRTSCNYITSWRSDEPMLEQSTIFPCMMMCNPLRSHGPAWRNPYMESLRDLYEPLWNPYEAHMESLQSSHGCIYRESRWIPVESMLDCFVRGQSRSLRSRAVALSLKRRPLQPCSCSVAARWVVCSQLPTTPANNWLGNVPFKNRSICLSLIRGL